VVCTTLGFALEIDGEANEQLVERLISHIRANIGRFAGLIEKSRRVWSLLKSGILVTPEEKVSLEREYERIKGAVAKRLETGVERPFRHRPMRELL